jgi:DNA-binding LacI/PurR family transcriptional regulator
MATEHLIERGHRRIALILDELEGWGPTQRQQGFRDVMNQVSDKSVQSLVLSAEENTPLDMAQRMMEAGCSAGILLSDNAGLAVYDALVNELELHVPDDFSIIGIENEAVSRFLHPRLTAIEQPLVQMAEACVGYIAGKALYRRQAKTPALLASRLIVRNSVKTMA